MQDLLVTVFLKPAVYEQTKCCGQRIDVQTELCFSRRQTLWVDATKDTGSTKFPRQYRFKYRAVGIRKLCNKLKNELLDQL